MTKTSEYISTGLAAAMCSVTPNTVLKWIKSGKIPAQRTPGGHYRIPRHAVKAIMSVTEEPTKLSGQKPFQYCWDFNSKDGQLQTGCHDCIVYRARTRRCYEVAKGPMNNGHAKIFCEINCDECEYYRLVCGQRPNVLIVSDQHNLSKIAESSRFNNSYNLGFTECEYQCSMLIENYRPDYVLLDCSMGTDRAREFARHLAQDPRIPLVRIVLVGQKYQFPEECDQEIFAKVELPLTNDVLDQFLGGLRMGAEVSDLNPVEALADEDQ